MPISNELSVQNHAFEVICGQYKLSADQAGTLARLRGLIAGLHDRAGTAASSMMTRLERSPLSPAQLSAPQGVEHYDPFKYLPHASPGLVPPKLDHRQLRTDVAKSLSNQIPNPISPIAGPHRPSFGNYGYEMPKLSSAARYTFRH